MKIYEAIYYYMLSPKEAIKKEVKFEYALIIFLMAAISISISALIAIGSRGSIFKLLILVFGISAYIAISNIIKIAVINLITNLLDIYNKDYIKKFIKNYFAIYGIFIFILPISLIFIKNGALFFIQAISFIIFQIYYFFISYHNIKTSFNINSSSKAFMILLSPIIIDYLTYISLIILIFGVFINSL
mgnify:CR=1 FL=1